MLEIIKIPVSLYMLLRFFKTTIYFLVLVQIVLLTFLILVKTMANFLSVYTTDW